MQTGLLPVQLLHVLLRLRLNELSPAVSSYAKCAHFGKAIPDIAASVGSWDEEEPAVEQSEVLSN